MVLRVKPKQTWRFEEEVNKKRNAVQVRGSVPHDNP